MREIKFRGKRVDNGEWVFGSLVQGDNMATIVIDYGSGHIQTYWVDPQTVGQFTGLHNKNGKEIYEGDIVQRGIITFSRGKFVGQYYGSNGNLYEEWEDDLYQENNIEVIGNIYENPELLK